MFEPPFATESCTSSQARSSSSVGVTFALARISKEVRSRGFQLFCFARVRTPFDTCQLFTPSIVVNKVQVVNISEVQVVKSTT